MDGHVDEAACRGPDAVTERRRVTGQNGAENVPDRVVRRARYREHGAQGQKPRVQFVSAARRVVHGGVET